MGRRQPPPPPPPPLEEAQRDPSPPATPLGSVVAVGSRGRGYRVPAHIREAERCEAEFKDLPFLAVEPFPVGQMKWDGDEPSPSPLRPIRRTPPSNTRTTPGVGSPYRDQQRGWTDPPAVETATPAPATEESAESGPAEEGRTSAFRRLRPSARHLPTRAPSLDWFPDLRRGPTSGVLFGNIRPLPYDSQDAPRQPCFNCW